MRPIDARPSRPLRGIIRRIIAGRNPAGTFIRRRPDPRLALIATAQIVGLMPTPTADASCFVESPTDEISIAFGGGHAASLRLFVYDRESAANGMSVRTSDPMSAMASRRCQASIAIPLSAFPTSRLATRPVDIARSMQDLVEKHGIEACEIAVLYENDTNEEIAEHELCLRETFAFGERKHWSIARERTCWEPDEFERASGIE